jgi:hypothetical protein
MSPSLCIAGPWICSALREDRIYGAEVAGIPFQPLDLFEVIVGRALYVAPFTAVRFYAWAVLTSNRCTCRLNNSLSEDGRPATETEWNSDFSSWLPRYQKPTHPCHYCDSKGLECFIFNPAAGKVSGCSPCNALFRPCSFTNPEKMPFLRTKTALDTLDVVTEDTAQCFGGRTGRKPMRMLGHAGPIVDDLLIPEATKKGAATRFSRDVVKILKNWLIQHADHPYPTEEEKEALKAETGLTVGQISNWMANTRRRQKARPKRDASPSLRPSTRPVNIPPGRTWDDLSRLLVSLIMSYCALLGDIPSQTSSPETHYQSAPFARSIA